MTMLLNAGHWAPQPAAATRPVPFSWLVFSVPPETVPPAGMTLAEPGSVVPALVVPGVANVSPGPLAGVLPEAKVLKIAVTGSFSTPDHTSTPPIAMKATGSPGTLAIATPACRAPPGPPRGSASMTCSPHTPGRRGGLGGSTPARACTPQIGRAH